MAREGRTGSRDLKMRVRTARKRSASSTRWLERQLNDPYVARAKREGYRSRAAYKLLELDDRFGFLKPGAAVVDIGAAPGGWTQVAAERVKAPEKGRVVAIDLLPMDPVPGVDILHMDFMAEGAEAALKEAIPGGADVVLSDMAASATGHRRTDHWKIMGLAEAAADFARDVLKPDGAFVAKVLRGGSENELLTALKRNFREVRHVKPPASRADSAELYVVALGFRGTAASEGTIESSP
jgi:23S rRNA (uridine2552-2'-O)-methyltransferase